jgi:hypothetical protein
MAKTANELTPEVMKAIGDLMANMLPGIGFALFLFDFNSNADGQYISNAQRPEMLSVMQKTIDRMKAKENQNEKLN